MSAQIVTYSPLAVANYFVKWSLSTGVEMTPMKLLKLVYISHGWNLALTQEPLISESVQAWKYGPVIKSVYNSFQSYGRSQITSMRGLNFYSKVPEVTDEFTIGLLNKIIEVYGSMDGIQLSALTHKPGTPWDTVWNKNGGRSRKEALIANSVIQDYYEGKIMQKTTA